MTDADMNPGEKIFSILVVDDNDISRSMLRFIVSSAPCYRVVGEADNGGRGLDMVARLRPDLVCLDIDMPDRSGLDLLKQIKSEWPGTAVLMVTGSDDRHSILRAVQDGANGYIVKPFDPDKLLSTLAQALAQA